MSIPVYNIQGEKVDKLEPDTNVFDGEVKKDVLYQVIQMYQANRRAGSASTKVRSEVRGGGRKPWKQKGTGRARIGSIRSPIWRGGGVVFGPHPKDYSYNLPKKVKRAALKYGLNVKLNEEMIVVVDNLRPERPKTKEFAAILSALNLSATTLVVLENKNVNAERASKNIPGVTVRTVNSLNAYDILLHDKLLITRDALALISANQKR